MSLLLRMKKKTKFPDSNFPFWEKNPQNLKVHLSISFNNKQILSFFVGGCKLSHIETEMNKKHNFESKLNHQFVTERAQFNCFYLFFLTCIFLNSILNYDLISRLTTDEALQLKVVQPSLWKTTTPLPSL